jgi:heterodisulfide reductase subunit C
MKTTFIDQVNHLSNQTIELCYHCHKCTSGCPVASDMEYGPDRVLRLVQMGEKECLFASHDIWLCASCETCGTRCPNEIDIAQVMDALRSMALATGFKSAEPDAVKFHKLFLFVVQTMGRMHEASLLVAYKLWTMKLMADMDSGALMIAKGKVPMIPHAIKGHAEVKHIFDQTQAENRE